MVNEMSLTQSRECIEKSIRAKSNPARKAFPGAQ